MIPVRPCNTFKRIILSVHDLHFSLIEVARATVRVTVISKAQTIVCSNKRRLYWHIEGDATFAFFSEQVKIDKL